MTAHLAVCGVGAGLAMAGHFPGRPRLWVPHALGLAAMLLAWLPAAQPVGTPAALLGLGALLAWQLSTRAGGGAGWPGLADTMAMAALIGLTIPDPAHSAGMAGMDHAAVDGTLPYAVAVLVVWLAVRHRTRAVRDVVRARPAASGRVLGALRFCGGLVMLSAMTGMLA
jgi:hypothetical protein